METYPRVLDADSMKHFVEVRTSEVCCRLESGEYTATGHSLKMLFTDVLHRN